MKHFLFFTSAILLVITNTFGCLNEYYSRDVHGEVHRFETGHVFDFEKPFYTDFDVASVEKKLLNLEKKLQTQKDYKLLSDYAVQLMYGGKNELAVQILKQLYFYHPESYQIASNLGTAYELFGKADSALKFIKIGLELNPNSHEKSEWVHVKILETKLELLKNPEYLNTHSVLNLTEKQKYDPNIRDQIYHQMQERFPFSPGPDLIMASMFIDLGDCFSTSLSIDYARALYNIAQFHFGADKHLVSSKKSELAVAQNKQKDKPVFITHAHEISYINYKSLLESRNSKSKTIAWEKIQLDLKTLLSYLELEFHDFTPIVLETKSVDTLKLKEAPKNLEQPSDLKLNWIVLSAFTTLALAIIYLSTRRKKK